MVEPDAGMASERGTSDASKPVQREVRFDAAAEIFATDNRGIFSFPLTVDEQASLELTGFDELRFTVSIWHPSDKHVIDYDKAYVEMRASLDPSLEHWTRIAEIEPVVPPYDTGQRFDGWIVLPVLGLNAAYQLYGGGFQPRSRIQICSSALFVG